MEDILISGGAGYIGCVLADQLLKEGYSVTVLDNLIHRNGAILEHCGNPKFRFVYGDVRNKDLYKKEIIKHNVIVNLAAYVGMPLCNRFPIETRQVNQDSAEFLAASVSPNQFVIHATTNSGYGLGQHKDGKAVFCTEETPLEPISLYGQTKCAAEKAIMRSGNNVSFRLATVMGVSRKMRMDLLVNDFTYRAWNDKFIVLFESSFLRNFVNVKDVAEAFRYAILNSDNFRGQIYNLGNTSANVNKMQLCHAIKKHIPEFYITESAINKDPDQRNYMVSNDKLEATGWKPIYSLDDTIREVLQACPIIKNANVPFSDI